MPSLLSHTAALLRKLTGRQLTPTEKYWQERKHFRYYREKIRLAREYAPTARSVLDVGPNGTPLVRELNWIPAKTAIDLRSARIRGVMCLEGDFLQFQPRQSFDLVICLQVVEHVTPAAEFVQKLLVTGKQVIIFVPYCWQAGSCKEHVHDPVDEAKLLGWAGRQPLEMQIVRDSHREWLVAMFAGADTAPSNLPVRKVA